MSEGLNNRFKPGTFNIVLWRVMCRVENNISLFKNMIGEGVAFHPWGYKSYVELSYS
jgi:hypothetical protein